MILFEALAADPNDWFIKWIDDFTLPLGRTLSPGVHVLLQRIESPAYGGGRQRRNLREVQALLGASGTRLPRMRCERVLAGWLPMLRVGAIVRGGRLVQTLPTQSRRLHLTNEMIAGETPDLTERSHEYVAELLRRWQYALVGEWETPKRVMLNSRCLVLSVGRTQYLIPRTLLFTTFYGFKTRLANAFCTGSWSFNAKAAISFRSYSSGIATAEKAVDNRWRIVLELGMTHDDVPRVAALWFDEHARARADAIFTQSLAPLAVAADPDLQVPPFADDSDDAAGEAAWEAALAAASVQPRRPGTMPMWRASALFPYPIRPERPIAMAVEGFELAPLLAQPETRSFLVTNILALDWPYPEVVIERALHNDASQSGNRAPTDSDRGAYTGGQGAPADVQGRADVIGTSASDPHAAAPTNLYQVPGFGWSGTEPNIQPQHKISSQIYERPPAAAPSVAEAGNIVSTGLSGHEADAPQKAEVTQLQRDLSARFEHLVAALESLQAQGSIDGWNEVVPSELNVIEPRGMRRCWSLLSEEDRKRGRIPLHGWEVLQVGGEHQTGKRYARAVLCIQVALEARLVTLFEIELRPGSQEATSLTAIASVAPLDELAVFAVLEAIRTAKHAPPEADLQRLVVACQAQDAKVIRHASQSDDERVVVGLDREALLRALRRVAGCDTPRPARKPARQRLKAAPCTSQLDRPNGLAP